MLQKSNLLFIAVGVIFVILMTILVEWCSKRTTKWISNWLRKDLVKETSPSDPSLILRFSRRSLFLGIFSVFFCVSCAMGSFYLKMNFIVWFLFIIYALIEMHKVMSYFNAQCTVRAYGFEYQNAFLHAAHLRWEEISQIKYLQKFNYFLCKKKNGKKVYLSPELIGFHFLAQKLIENVSSEVIDPKSLEVLSQTAAGNFPV